MLSGFVIFMVIYEKLDVIFVYYCLAGGRCIYNFALRIGCQERDESMNEIVVHRVNAQQK